MSDINDFERALQASANPTKAKLLARFFKTGKGEYGEGDTFLGVTVPNQRKIAKRFQHLTLVELKKFLDTQVHEHRFSALEILVMQYEKASKSGNEKEKQAIVQFYIRNAERINNWDLVDTSASYLIGDYLLHRDKSVLYRFARSANLWKRRIAIISTGHFIHENQFNDTLAIADILLHDKHDLIHKAVGWMLREVGKRSLKTEESFLKEHATHMPRTMLRYAIEKFPKEKRMIYLTNTQKRRHRVSKVA